MYYIIRQGIVYIPSEMPTIIGSHYNVPPGIIEFLLSYYKVKVRNCPLLLHNRDNIYRCAFSSPFLVLRRATIKRNRTEAMNRDSSDERVDISSVGKMKLTMYVLQLVKVLHSTTI